jgi:hypothetical protein
MTPRDYRFIERLPDKKLRRQAMRELCRTDLYFLCRYVLGYEDMEDQTDIHYRMCSELDRVDTLATLVKYGIIRPGEELDRYLRYLLLVFRGGFKTSICLGKVIQWLIRDRDAQIGIGSDTKERATGRTKDLRDVIEQNEKLKWLFPDVFYKNPANASDLWKMDEFNIRRTRRDLRKGGFSVASVTAFGLFPMPTGWHFDRAYIDDLENDDNCKNDDMIEKLNHALGLFIPILRPTAPFLVSGTIYNESGPNNLLSKRWYTYRRPIEIGVDKKPSFPRMYPRVVIDRIRRDITDEWVWNGQYLLKASTRTDKFLYPFRGVKIRKVTVEIATIFHEREKLGRTTREAVSLAECTVFITVDPGGGASEQTATRRTDKVGWCVNAVDVQGRWHILDMGARHMDDPGLMDFLFFLHDKWHPYVLGVEPMPHLEPYMRLSYKMRGRALVTHPLTPKRRDKSDRIKALNAYWPTIYFADTLDLEGHIQGWYVDKEHGDDDLDALAYQIDIVHAPTKEQLQRQKEKYRELEEQSQLEQLPPRERREWERIRKAAKRPPADEAWEQEIGEFYGGGAYDHGYARDAL